VRRQQRDPVAGVGVEIDSGDVAVVIDAALVALEQKCVP
jgi:hypothetical protein